MSWISRVPIRPVARDVALPLALPQEQIWFIEQLDPTSISYRFQSTLRFTGRLDVVALERSLDAVVRRHEIYRTTFPEVDEERAERVSQSLGLPERFVFYPAKMWRHKNHLILPSSIPLTSR